MSTIGQGGPPGANMIAIIVRPMPSETRAPVEQLAAFCGPLGLVGVATASSLPAAAALAPDVIARGLDGGHDPGAVDARRVEPDRGALGREVDVRLGHAIGAVEEALDAVHAARAGHARRRAAVSSVRGFGGGAVTARSGYYRGVSRRAAGRQAMRIPQHTGAVAGLRLRGAHLTDSALARRGWARACTPDEALSTRMRMLPMPRPGAEPAKATLGPAGAPMLFVVDDDLATLELLCEIGAGRRMGGPRIHAPLRVLRALARGAKPTLAHPGRRPARWPRRRSRAPAPRGPAHGRDPILVCTAAHPMRQAEIGAWAPVISKPFDLAEIEAFLAAAAHQPTDPTLTASGQARLGACAP